MMGSRAPSDAVLFVTYDGLMEPLGRAQVLPYVLALAGRGFRMSVLSFEKRADLERSGDVAELGAALDRAGVLWERLPYHRWPTVPATAWDVLRGVGRIRRLSPGLIHARSYVPGFMALRGRGHRRRKILADLRGFWIDERIEGRGWSPGSPLVRFARRVERKLLEEADHLVVLTEAARRSLPHLADAGAFPGATVIPTCVDLERFTVPDPPGRGPLRGLTPPVLVHSGTLGGRYQAERTMRVARAFVERTGGSFLAVTRETEGTAGLAAAAGVPVTCVSAAHGEMPGWLAACDAGLALVEPGFSTHASAPTKVGEYLATGLAVAATAIGDLESHFADASASFVVSGEESPENVARRLAESVALPGRQRESRALAERYYALDRAVDSFARIYERLGVRPCA